MAECLKEIKEKLGEAVLGEFEFRGEETLILDRASLPHSMEVLREEFGFDCLVDLCGVDMGVGESPRFYVVYHLRNMETRAQLRIKVGLEDGESVPSVCRVWPGANWMEREAYDMFGIKFEGHPNLTRLYLTDDFPGHPLRKDYPTEGYDFEE